MAERKKYVGVEIPILDSQVEVLGTLENLKGKTIKLDLTRKMRGKGLTIKFKIFRHGDKLFAIPKSMELVKAYIRRMMRKRTDYIEDSFITKCADFRAVVKPFLITRKRVSRVVRKNLRNTAREFLVDYLKDREYNEICKELLDGNLQKTMLPKLKKVYPLSFCDIRIFETKELEKIDLENAIKKQKMATEPEVIEEEPLEEKELPTSKPARVGGKDAKEETRESGATKKKKTVKKVKKTDKND